MLINIRTALAAIVCIMYSPCNIFNKNYEIFHVVYEGNLPFSQRKKSPRPVCVSGKNWLPKSYSHRSLRSGVHTTTLRRDRIAIFWGHDPLWHLSYIYVYHRQRVLGRPLRFGGIVYMKISVKLSLWSNKKDAITTYGKLPLLCTENLSSSPSLSYSRYTDQTCIYTHLY